MDWKLELIQVPVADIDRAKRFYAEKVGFVAEHDGNAWSVQQLPPRP